MHLNRNLRFNFHLKKHTKDHREIFTMHLKTENSQDIQAYNMDQKPISLLTGSKKKDHLHCLVLSALCYGFVLKNGFISELIKLPVNDIANSLQTGPLPFKREKLGSFLSSLYQKTLNIF